MMRTLTHEPLAGVLAAVLIIAIIAGLTVWAALLISKLRTDRVASATGAAGPDVPRAEASGPGRTRPSAMGGGRSAGSSERPRPWRRDAKAEGLAGPEAADMAPSALESRSASTAPEGAPAALSGATPREFCATCGKWQPGPHMDWCYRAGGVVRGCVYCAQIGNEEHSDDCPRKVWSDPLDLHIATAAALLSPAAPVERDPEFADTVEGWLRSVTPPVVPGKDIR